MSDNPEEKDEKEGTEEVEPAEEAPVEETSSEEAPVEEEAPAEVASSPEEQAPLNDVKAVKPKREKKPKSDGPNYKKQWFIIFFSLLVIFAIGYTPWRYTSSPEACAQCHSMKPYYDSYKKSWHGKNETPCDNCHVRPGMFAYYTYRIGFYREIYAEIFNKDLAPWGATTPGEAACTRGNCHSLNRLASMSGDIKVNHAIHVKVTTQKYGKACSYCHAGASHAGIKGLGLQLPPRRQCFDCHKDKLKQCDYCHSTKYKPGTVPKTPHI